MDIFCWISIYPDICKSARRRQRIAVATEFAAVTLRAFVKQKMHTKTALEVAAKCERGERASERPSDRVYTKQSRDIKCKQCRIIYELSIKSTGLSIGSFLSFAASYISRIPIAYSLSSLFGFSTVCALCICLFIYLFTRFFYAAAAAVAARLFQFEKCLESSKLSSLVELSSVQFGSVQFSIFRLIPTTTRYLFTNNNSCNMYFMSLFVHLCSRLLKMQY